MESLLLLSRTHQVSLSGMRLTLPVLLEESRVMSERPQMFPLAHKRGYDQLPPVEEGWFAGLRSVMGTAASYLPYGSAEIPIPVEAGSDAHGYYGRSAEDLLDSGVPSVMDDLRSTIISECSKTEGIFRGTPGVSLPLPRDDPANKYRPHSDHLLSLCSVCLAKISQYIHGKI